MPQNLVSILQFRLIKWSFLVHSTMRIMLLIYTQSLIRFSNCDRLKRMCLEVNSSVTKLNCGEFRSSPMTVHVL